MIMPLQQVGRPNRKYPMDLDQDGSPVHDVPDVRRQGRNWQGRGGKNGRGICHFKEKWHREDELLEKLRPR